MLGAVGLTDDEELVYRILLERPRSTPSEIAALSNLTRAQVRRLASTLGSKGLVSRASGEPAAFMPARPDIAIEALARRRLDEIDRARVEAARLTEILRGTARGTGQSEPVEIVSGRDAMHHRFVQLQSAAMREVLIFDRPPYVSSPPAPNEQEWELLGRGVSFRVIYDRRSFDLPGKLDAMERSVAAGELARTFNGVPLKMIVADARLALTYDTSSETIHTGLVVHRSPLLDALVFLFESLWLRAVPLGSGRAHEELDDQNSRILTLLGLGLKDDAIAREMRISHRTVQRRVSEILATLGVASRFQAGLQAAKRGLL